MKRSEALSQPMSAESLLSQQLKAQAASLRSQADILEALAMAHSGGTSSDLLKPSDVQKLLNCGESKAREIVRAHGIGAGKMGRIERGVLMQLQRDGKLSGRAG